MAEPTYDPKLHITAGELRAAGMEVPPEIPSPAWIPRWAFKVEGERVENNGNTLVINVSVTEPFRWVEVTLTAKNKEEADRMMLAFSEMAVTERKQGGGESC